MTSTPHGLTNIPKDIGLFTDRSRSDDDSGHEVHHKIFRRFVHKYPQATTKKSIGDKSGDVGGLRRDHRVQSIYVQTTGILHRYREESILGQILMHLSEQLVTGYGLRWNFFPFNRAAKHPFPLTRSCTDRILVNSTFVQRFKLTARCRRLQ
ncbi:hypothetical protein AVEN_245175-1 [Araneus ventricosus]|uniref:Uncharacterized protein n=1 Tax=Araneus ventricosus TaxID=182803 RepID=A0A4Y2MC26_ARAVE|nr:hypothetical protein AVEN_245175-1 [Araneus ventricosus]